MFESTRVTMVTLHQRERARDNDGTSPHSQDLEYRTSMYLVLQILFYENGHRSPIP